MAKRKGNRQIWLILGAIAVILIFLFIAKQAGWIGEEQKVEVQTTSSELRTIHSRVTESGIIEPTIDVPVAPDVSGEVINILIVEGMNVKKGDLLLSIQPDDYEAVLEQTQASLNQAKSAYLRAQSDLEQAQANMMQDSVSYARNKKLFDESVISQVDLENSSLALKVSRSRYKAADFSVKSSFYQVKNAEASVKQARQNLDRTNIYASMDGTITLLDVEIGQRVVGTRQMAGTEILKIADLTNMEVVVEINENDIVNVSLGDSAKVEVDAYPDMSFYGKVSEIAYSAQVTGMASSDQVTNFQVKVQIAPTSYESTELGKELKESRQSPFRPGMTALVEIYTNSAADVVSVPIQAVTLSRGTPEAVKEANEVVFVVENGAVVQKPVITGISDDEFIEIRDGLPSDAEIVTGPYTVLSKKLEDKMAIEVKNKDKKEE